MSNPAPSVVFHIPDDQQFLAAVGEVALAHAHLDHMLRLTIKSLAGVSVTDARLATAGYSSASLREEVKVLAKKSLGDGPALITLRAFITRAKMLSRERNDLVHSICAKEINIEAVTDAKIFGDAVLLDEELRSRPLPSADEIKALASKIGELVNLLNGFRLHGFRTPPIPDRRESQIAKA